MRRIAGADVDRSRADLCRDKALCSSPYEYWRGKRRLAKGLFPKRRGVEMLELKVKHPKTLRSLHLSKLEIDATEDRAA